MQTSSLSNQALIPGQNGPIAVLVCHGMGQQAPFETLNEVAEALVDAHEAEHWKTVAPSSPCCTTPAIPPDMPSPEGGPELGRVDFQYVAARQANNPAKQLEPLAKLAMRAPQHLGGHVQEFHFYEAYWAPLTEGTVGITDVLQFLLRAALDGITARQQFARYVFGNRQEYTTTVWTKVNLVAAFLTVVSLLFIAVSFLGVVISDAARSLALIGGSQLTEVLRCQLSYLAPWIAAGALFPLLNAWAQRARRNSSSKVALTLDIATALLAIVPIVLFGLRTCWAWLSHNDIWLLATMDSYVLVLVYTMLLALLGVYLARSYRFRRPFATLIIGLMNASLAIIVIHEISTLGVPCLERRTEYYWWQYSWVLEYLFFVASGTTIVYATWYFLVKFAGDVTAYVSAHSVNKFWSTREGIQTISVQTALAVFNRKTAEEAVYYQNIVVAAHSLGAVVAYDTLNTLINLQECGATPTLDNVAERTRLFLTYGCPLNKIAFLFRYQTISRVLPKWRDLLNNYRQPLILNIKYRPQRWINIWSYADWISGPLTYYEPKGKQQSALPGAPIRTDGFIDDRLDPDAFFPLYEHTTYEKHRIFREMLYQGIWGPTPSVKPHEPSRSVFERSWWR